MQLPVLLHQHGDDALQVCALDVLVVTARAELAELRLTDVTTTRVDDFLEGKSPEYSPVTINHLRAFLVAAFRCGIRAGRFTGKNPIKDVPRRRVPRKKPSDYLRAQEIPPMMAALEPRWRPLFAAALYTGMRRGELLGLRKVDVDLGARLITVQRSHGRDVPKGKDDGVIPIADELLPYLEQAIALSPSELVFPAPHGGRMREDVKLELVLRRALARAGLVLGYEHVCRRKGCGHRERATDGAIRRCPKDRYKLWPRALVRQIKFHHLRHTTGSLMMMAGANPGAVQRVLRHTDPRTTMDFYAHLAPGYLRNEVNLLQFGLRPAPPPLPPEEAPKQAANAEEPAPFAASLLQGPAEPPF
jgi:integrase